MSEGDDKAAVTQRYRGFEGSWTGENKLWFEPDSPVRTSPASAKVELTAGDQFLRVEYTWVFKERPQSGTLLIAHDPKTGRSNAGWIDSWHMSAVLMRLEEKLGEGEQGAWPDALDVRGEYEVGEGHPNWGWRIRLSLEEERLCLRMWNIHPEGQEDRAVEAIYTRAS